MECLECNEEVEKVDTTYSNYNSERTYKGQHTGDIYNCTKCDKIYIDDHIIGKFYEFSY